MILEGMTIDEVRRQLKAEKRDVEKLRKEATRTLNKKSSLSNGDIATLSGTSKGRNFYLCQAYKTKSGVRTMVMCVAPLMGKSDDYIFLKGDDVVVFTAHAVKRIKERVEMEYKKEEEEIDRKVLNGMMLFALFGDNEAYPGMSANIDLLKQMDINILNLAHSDGKMFWFVKCRVCVMLVEVTGNHGYIVRTIISDKMARDSIHGGRFQRSAAVITMTTAAHILLNKGMYTPETVKDCVGQVKRAVDNGMNPIMFNFHYFPKARMDTDIIAFHLADIAYGRKARTKATAKELIDFADEKIFKTLDVNKFNNAK